MVQQIQHNFANNLERKDYERNREVLKRLINTPREKVDFSVFKKNTIEKNKLWEMKQEWKKGMLNCYPNPKIRKQMNNPMTDC